MDKNSKKERVVLKVSKDVVENDWCLPDDYDPDIVEVVANEVVDKSRWSYMTRIVIHHKESNKYYESYYDLPATEYQECEMWGYDDTVTFTEVFPIEKTVIVFA